MMKLEVITIWFVIAIRKLECRTNIFRNMFCKVIWICMIPVKYIMSIVVNRRRMKIWPLCKTCVYVVSMVTREMWCKSMYPSIVLISLPHSLCESTLLITIHTHRTLFDKNLQRLCLLARLTTGHWSAWHSTAVRLVQSPMGYKE